ncbi:hypothetical protein QJR52_02760 [Clostridium baratii]|uniref:hypothetical protein n=1 Tax=Clostridium baratii TaxID=1561 RepID=UPI0030CE9438
MGSCATASAFGWDFQCNAAIVFMLENIDFIDSIRVEGKTEDIEMTCNDGKKIYGQAKSIVKYDDYDNVLKCLKKSLKTLNEASKNIDTKKLIYVTNTPNPFKKNNTMGIFYGRSQLRVKDLPMECVDVIDKYIKKYKYGYIDKEKLEINVIPFHGDGANRYKIVKQTIMEFLYRLGVIETGLSQKVMDIWQKDFFHNASQSDTSIIIHKKDFIWTIVISASENINKDLELEEFDISEYEYIEEKYHEVIDSKSEMFSFVNEVIVDYEMCKEFRERDKMDKFIEKYWDRYISDFEDSGLENRIIEGIIKIILNRILRKRIMIKKIKNEVNI